MQLKGECIRTALALATGTLLNIPVHAGSWEIESALLLYSELNQVTAIEPVLRLKTEISEQEYLSARIVIDGLTGASPNGASEVAQPQVFTTPSGNATYAVAANQLPLDPTFRDTRGALQMEWEKPLSSVLRRILSLNISSEFDYQSTSLSGVLTRDFSKRNTTLTAGFSVGFDYSDPVGGIPQGAAWMPKFDRKKTRASGEGIVVMESLVGITQLLSPRSLVQINYSAGQDSGYLTDPYKILSVVDNNGTLVNNPDNYPYIFENRPDKRLRHTLYARTLYQYKNDVINASYRWYNDSWGVQSHTIDLHYRAELNSKPYIEPHLRYYSQGQADFYYYQVNENELLTFLSADYRLGKMTTLTMGAKFGYTLKKGELSLRAEFMRQQSDSLFPGVDALILQLSYETTL